MKGEVIKVYTPKRAQGVQVYFPPKHVQYLAMIRRIAKMNQASESYVIRQLLENVLETDELHLFQKLQGIAVQKETSVSRVARQLLIQQLKKMKEG